MLNKAKKVCVLVAIVFVLSAILAPMSYAAASAGSLSSVGPIEVEAVDWDIIDLGELSATDEADVARLASAEKTLSLSGNTSSMSSTNLGGNEISEADISVPSALTVPQPRSLTFGIGNGISTLLAAAANDNVNNPIGLGLGTYYSQTIDAVGDSRWFATITTAATTKLTTALAMASNVDFDLYIYKLNGSSLNLVAYSALTGNGVQEVSNYMAAPGTYFFRVVACSGTGGFAIYNFGSAAFDAYEPNDSTGAPSVVTLTSTDEDASIVGNLDNPVDHDFYAIVFPGRTKVAFNLVLSSDSDADYVLMSGNSAVNPAVSAVVLHDSGDPTEPFVIRLEVLSPTGYFDDTDDYTLEVNQLAYTPGTDLMLETFDHSIIVEADYVSYENEDGEEDYYIGDIYINGNPFNWMYHWVYLYSNSGGGYTYVVHSEKSLLNNVHPGFAYTHIYNPNIGFQPLWPATYSSDLPDHSNKVFTADNPALIIGLNGLYAYSSRTAYGAYESDTSNWTEAQQYATLVVDPSNGLIVDVIDPNGLYSKTPQTYHFSIGEVPGYISMF
jgi:hypothetical protein